MLSEDIKNVGANSLIISYLEKYIAFVGRDQSQREHIKREDG